MKKILIAAIAGLAMQVSMSEAQQLPKPEMPVVKKYVDPPPPPPPPPLARNAAIADIPPEIPAPPNPPAPPAPETPPVPPVAPVPPVNEIEYVSSEQNTERVKTMVDANEKGFVLAVRRENQMPVVVIRKEGYTIRKISLKEWLADTKKYEGIYGKLPPPPPPLPRSERR